MGIYGNNYALNFAISTGEIIPSEPNIIPPQDIILKTKVATITSNSSQVEVLI